MTYNVLFFVFYQSRGSCGDLQADNTGVSPSDSVTSMPSCLPFPWFGEKGREKEEEGKERGRIFLRSVSSSSLPYMTTTGRRDQVRWSGRAVYGMKNQAPKKGIKGDTVVDMYCRQPRFVFLVPECGLLSGQLQQGGILLWSLPLWTLSHFHLFLHWGETIPHFPSSFPVILSCFLPRLCSFSFVLFDFFPPLALMSHQTLDDDPVPSNNNNLWQSRPVLEWDSQQVCLWLTALNMEQYMSEFATRGVDGTQLLNMDTDKLKASSPSVFIFFFPYFCNYWKNYNKT